MDGVSNSVSYIVTTDTESVLAKKPNHDLWYDGMLFFSVMIVTRVHFWRFYENVLAVPSIAPRHWRCSPSNPDS